MINTTTCLLFISIACALFGLTLEQNSIGSSAPQSILTATTTAGGSVIRLRANRLRRPEFCRESLPRKSDDLPALVVTARVKEVYLSGEDVRTSNVTNITTTVILNGVATTSTQSFSSAGGASNIGSDPRSNKALVNIIRVIKGNKQLDGADIIISGFNSSSSTPCPNFVKPNDTLILLLNQEGERRYSIQNSNLLSMNLNNLDRINAIAADEPYKRRGPIEDISCEAHYCPYGRCVVANERTGQLTCQCPDSCPPLPQPVCGSDNTTYTNECHLIKEGCNRRRPLFVTKESSC